MPKGRSAVAPNPLPSRMQMPFTAWFHDSCRLAHRLSPTIAQASIPDPPRKNAEQAASPAPTSTTATPSSPLFRCPAQTSPIMWRRASGKNNHLKSPASAAVNSSRLSLLRLSTIRSSPTSPHAPLVRSSHSIRHSAAASVIIIVTPPTSFAHQGTKLGKMGRYKPD